MIQNLYYPKYIYTVCAQRLISVELWQKLGSLEAWKLGGKVVHLLWGREETTSKIEYWASTETLGGQGAASCSSNWRERHRLPCLSTEMIMSSCLERMEKEITDEKPTLLHIDYGLGWGLGTRKVACTWPRKASDLAVTDDWRRMQEWIQATKKNCFCWQIITAEGDHMSSSRK